MNVFQVEGNTTIQKEVFDFIRKLPVGESVEVTRVGEKKNASCK